MTDWRIAGLCSGTGALEMAAQDVLGGTVIWHCQWEPPNKDGKPDKWQYAARILEHHWPDVPNYGDITAVDWSQVERPHVLGMGFPCTDVSSAGLREGIAEGNRSGVWFHCARAIRELRPDLIVIENVEGLLSAKADRGVGATDADVEAAGDDALRALGCVLGDLADLGYDTEWCRIGADEVGAPHRRRRIIILAWPAAWPAADAARERHRNAGTPSLGRLSAPALPSGAAAPADAADLGHERHWDPRDWRTGPANGHRAPADPRGLSAGNDGELPPGRHAVQQWVRDDTAGRGTQAASDARGSGPQRPCSAEERQSTATEHRGTPATADTDRGGLGVDELDAPAGESDFDWRAYGPAIRRWEHVLGRPAPRPVDDRGRLAAPFVEWMMGLPEGHVCDVPAPDGMTAAGLRNARLKALGNGVVRQQAAYALRLLLDRARREVAA